MDKQERVNTIVSILKNKSGASIKELSHQLDVTEMTVRRDIKYLKENKIVQVVSGAVIYNGSDPNENKQDEYDLTTQKNNRASEKYNIGKLAASLIEPNDIIFIDIGTTTAQIIEHIPSNHSVEIVCCTMNALIEIHKKGFKDFILIGGHYRPELQMFESREGLDLISRTRTTKAFISAAGVNAKLGITCTNSCEVNTKNAAIHCALEKILVIDSSKFDMVKSTYFASLNDFDAIVTDRGLSEEWIEKIKQLDITLYLA